MRGTGATQTLPSRPLSSARWELESCQVVRIFDNLTYELRAVAVEGMGPDLGKEKDDKNVFQRRELIRNATGAGAKAEEVCPCGVSVEVHDHTCIKAKAMEAFLTIAQGSCIAVEVSKHCQRFGVIAIASRHSATDQL